MTHRIKTAISRALAPTVGRRSDADFDRHVDHIFGAVASPSDAPAGEPYPTPAAELRAALVPLGAAVTLSVVVVLGIALSTPGT